MSTKKTTKKAAPKKTLAAKKKSASRKASDVTKVTLSSGGKKVMLDKPIPALAANGKANGVHETNGVSHEQTPPEDDYAAIVAKLKPALLDALKGGKRTELDLQSALAERDDIGDWASLDLVDALNTLVDEKKVDRLGGDDDDEEFFALANTIEIIKKPKTRYLEHFLTPEERAEKHTQLEKNFEQVEGLDGDLAQLKEDVKNLDAKIKGLHGDNKAIARVLRKGSEYRNIECREDRDDRRCEVDTVRLDTNEVIETRPFTADERQGDLFSQHELQA